MSTHLVTFSDSSMGQSAALCAYSARKNGVEWVRWWKKEELELTEEYKANKSLFEQPRGCGYWAFKPVIINHAMDRALTGDIIGYSDAGVEFIDNVNHIIDRMDQDIFLFGNMYEHAHWCKADIVKAIWPLKDDSGQWAESEVSEDSWARFGKQCQASVIFFRVSDYSRKFVTEWLDWCLFEGGRLIDDSPCQFNHPEFKENRHDQAILTTLAYREGIPLHWWPAVYNDGAFTYPKGEYTDDYPPLFHHHRKRNHEWEQVA